MGTLADGSYRWDDLNGFDSQLITVGEETHHRFLSGTTSASQASQNLRLAYFTARKTETILTLATVSGGTAAGATPTLVRLGVWTASLAGDLLELVASTANDTTLYAAANTLYVKALQAPWGKVAGQRYAVGTLVVTAATAPTLLGHLDSVVAPVHMVSPATNGIVAGQADLPATLAAASVTGSATRVYAVMSP